MNEPLLPCPWCKSNNLHCDGHYIECQDCHAQGPSLYPIPYTFAVHKAWNTRTPPPSSMKWPEEKEEIGPVELKYKIRGWNLCLRACKELNAPNVEQSGYFTENPKFTEEQKGNIMDRSKIIIRLMSGIFGLTHDQAEVVADWHISEMNTKPSEKNELTYCKHKILEPHCDECFPASEDYCAETVIVPDIDTEKKECKHTRVALDEALSRECIDCGYKLDVKKEGK